MQTSDLRATRIVVTEGDLPGLVASVIASEETVRADPLAGDAPVLWCPSARSLRAVRAHGRALGLRVLSADPPIATGVQPGERENHLLLQAGATALRHACPTIVWPVVPQGPAPDSPAPVEAIANIVNRATLMSRLVSLDAGQAGIPEVRVETPFVDLSDAQLADLACDVGARFEDCWWWADDSGAASVERARWGPLLPVPG